MASLGAFLNLQQRVPSGVTLRSLVEAKPTVEEEVNILAEAAQERQKQDAEGPSFRPANPMQDILAQEKVGAFNALSNIPFSPLAGAIAAVSPGAYTAMTRSPEGANPEVPNMIAALDQMSLGGLIDTPVASGLMRTKAPTMREFAPARLRGKLFDETPETGPTFFSQARRVIEDPKTQGTQTGEAWSKFLTDPKRGVKSEEMQWTGLGDLLKSKSGQRVTRDEILGHLDANEIGIQEVTKGARGINPEDIQKADEEMRRTGIVMRQNRTPENVEAFNAAVERYENLKLDFDGDKRETKFSQYTLPGAKNYREVLLTTPEKDQGFYWLTEPTTAEPNPGAGGGWLVRDANGKPHSVRYNATAEGALEQSKRNGPTQVAEEGRPAETVREFNPDFKGGHWDEPNVLAHLRLSDREVDGKRTLLVEEIQSDWAQKGRREGFADPTPLTFDEWKAKHFADSTLSDETLRMRYDTAMSQDAAPKKSGIPTAPFVTDTGKWTTLSLKRVLKMAADEGYDAVGIVPGAEQAKRYDLSKQVDKLLYKQNADGTYKLSAQITGQGGRMLGESIPASKLEDHVGKEVADRIVSGTGDAINLGGPGTISQPKDMWTSLAGEGLKVGGEGMKGYYDKIVPDALNKLAKEYGVKVNIEGGKVQTGGVADVKYTYTGPSFTLETIPNPKGLDTRSHQQLNDIKSRMRHQGVSFEEAMQQYGSIALAEALGGKMKVENLETTTPIHTLEVPESMRKQIKKKGFPLYSSNSIGGLLQQNA